ncbi:tetratricopeptide repeat protein [Pengzhenrongella sicca]|uniref:Tetratricopeptide repeat protein n=1 Tax=Pengzhenrongella sicca TaxID=2819238 RepID=A0A8A4ZF83_9MICO|nr:tetratricopeptide repeat protein [Pengzhenrongella sicca]QTE30071.1 tetratricopeptide repeat protein [Pengzhenrongella sicca]
MNTSLPFRIFLASPSDATHERKAIRDCVAQFNARGVRSGTYEVVGYESVRGTARRPQAAINDLIHECHFLIAVFAKSWGSEPGSPWGYSSGTEEEIFTALLDLARDARPMKDVWVAFMDTGSIVTAPVETFRQQIINKNALYFETCANEDDLGIKLSQRLEDWSKLEFKEARRVSLIPSSGIDILGAERMRTDGEKLVELGYAEQGLSKLKQAAQIGGPEEKLAYARFLGRSGRFTEAHVAVSEAISHFVNGPGDMRSTAAAEAYAADATLWRREKQYVKAAAQLQHALGLLNRIDVHSRTVRARVYDDLGLTQHAQHDLDSARKSFEAAHELRIEIDDPALIAQSEINLARIWRAIGTRETAESFARSAAARLKSLPPTAVHANSFVLIAQQHLYAKNFPDAEGAARVALALNEQFANGLGRAISNFVLARALLAQKNYLEAIRCAQESVRLNGEMRNTSGSDQAQGLLESAIAALREAPKP